MVWNFFSLDDVEQAFVPDSALGVTTTPKSKLGSLSNSPKHKEVLNEEEPEKTVEEALECDYERDCTPLYKAIENAMKESDFEPIVKFLDTGYWPGSFFADSIPPSDQVKTWVTRFDLEDNQKVKWSQLPLHLAIVCNAPASVIGRLVKLYPQALRCTDDQHMLPLHLALRHNADDEIIAFLLIRFPDAVNAKGKNGRTAVECAMRAKDKLRGKILEIFVEKTKGKNTSSLSKENKLLKAEIEKRNVQLDSLKGEIDVYRADYDNLKTLKNSIESDLLVKIQEVEQSKAELEAEYADRVERLKSEKLLQNIEVQKKMDELSRTQKALEQAETKAREDEASLRRELDSVQDLVNRSVSPDDWTRLKKEVELLQAYRLQHTRSETKSKIETLKGELEQTMQLTRNSESQNVQLKRTMESELNTLKNNIKRLERSESSARTSGELLALRSEVDQLKKELKERSQASRTKVELVVLKKAMETELRNAEGKTQDEIKKLKAAIQATNTDRLDSKTNDELTAMKADLEKLKYELQERELASNTKRDIEDIHATLDYKINRSRSIGDIKSRTEYEDMKRSIDAMRTNINNRSSNDDLVTIKKDLEEFKDQLKKKETTSKIVAEAETIKKSLEKELKKSEGKTQKELLKMKDAIKGLSATALANKDVNELSAIKAELTNVKDQLKIVEKVTQTHQDLEDLKKSLAEELKVSAGRTEGELQAMKRAVDEINLEHQASKSLKETLESEIKAASGKTELELMELKKALDKIDLHQLEVRNKTEWERMRTEIQGLKEDLKKKKNTAALTSDKEISEIKQIVDDIKAQQASREGLSNNYLKELRQEMDMLKADLRNKSIDEDNLKREIELLKEDGKKQKQGFKKFFGKRLTSWKYPKLSDVDEDDTDPEDPNTMVRSPTSSDVVTFRPPSLAGNYYAKKYKYVLQQSSSSSSECETASEPATNPDGTTKEPPLVVIERASSGVSRSSRRSSSSKRSTRSERPPLPQMMTTNTTPTPVVSSEQHLAATKDCCSIPPPQARRLSASSARSGISKGSNDIMVETVTSADSRTSRKSTSSKQPLVPLATILSNSIHTDSDSIRDGEQRDAPPIKTASQESEESGKERSGGFLFNRIKSASSGGLLFRKSRSLAPVSSPSMIATTGQKETIDNYVPPPPAYPVTRTMSRTVINENGDVELETVVA